MFPDTRVSLSPPENTKIGHVLILELILQPTILKMCQSDDFVLFIHLTLPWHHLDLPGFAEQDKDSTEHSPNTGDFIEREQKVIHGANTKKRAKSKDVRCVEYADKLNCVKMAISENDREK